MREDPDSGEPFLGSMRPLEPLKLQELQERQDPLRRRPDEAASALEHPKAAASANEQDIPPANPATPDAEQLAPMSLPQLAVVLARPEHLGARAPSLVTLKRWSAAGHLEQAQHKVPGRSRALYRLEMVKQICLAKQPARAQDVSQAAPASADLTPVLDRLQALEAQASRQEQLMVELTAQVSKLHTAVAALDHVRRSLMTRYDNEMTLLRSRHEQMQNAVRDTPSLEVAAARLTQTAHRLEHIAQALNKREPDAT